MRIFALFAFSAFSFVACNRCQGASGLKKLTGEKYEAETQSWVAALESKAQSGMWLVTRGYHASDHLVAMSTNSPVSHVAIIDFEQNQVIEAIGKGVITTNIEKFLRGAHLVQLIKPKGFSTQAGKLAVKKARAKIGAKYDFLGTVGLPVKKRWYCSELAMWSMGMTINRKGPHRVLHPRTMKKYGTVLFESGTRDGVVDFEKSKI